MHSKSAILVLSCLVIGCNRPSGPPQTRQTAASSSQPPAAGPAAATPTAPADVVATVLGQTIRRNDCLSRVQGVGSVDVGIYRLVLGLLMEDFSKSQSITLTDDEIDALWKVMRAAAERSNPDPSKSLPEPAFDEAAVQSRMKQAQDKLAAADVPLLEKLALQSQVRLLQRGLEQKSPASLFAYEQLYPLRLEAALYKKYGGKVVARQISIQAAGAYLKLAEEAQANGQLKFHDESLKQSFWKQLNDDLAHPEVPPERVDFSLPAWLQGGQ